MKTILPKGTSRSGSITAGGTAQIVAPYNDARVGMSFQNTSSGDLRLTENFTTASATNGFKIAPGASAEIMTRHSVSVWGATTGQTFESTEV